MKTVYELKDCVRFSGCSATKNGDYTFFDWLKPKIWLPVWGNNQRPGVGVAWADIWLNVRITNKKHKEAR